MTGAFAPSDESSARRSRNERQPNIAMGGDLSTELALPRDFEAVAELVREEDLDETARARQRPGRVARADRASTSGPGFTHVALHNVGEEQAEFIEFARQLL